MRWQHAHKHASMPYSMSYLISMKYIYMCVCVSSIYRSPPPIPHRSLLDSRVFDVRRIRCWTIARRRVASRWLQSWGNVSMYGQGDAVRCVFSQCGICQPIWKHIHIIQQKHLTGLTIHNCFFVIQLRLPDSGFTTSLVIEVLVVIGRRSHEDECSLKSTARSTDPNVDLKLQFNSNKFCHELARGYHERQSFRICQETSYSARTGFPLRRWKPIPRITSFKMK